MSASPSPSPRDPDPASGLVRRGIQLHRAGDRAGALAAFEQAVAANPASAPAQLHAGVARLQQGHWPRGVAHLRVAVAADPKLAEAWSNLALGWREMGRTAQAREAVERALACDPRLAPAWNLHGLVLQDEERTREAGASFERALALDPSFALAAMNWGNGLQKLGELEAAHAAYRRALAINADEPEIHYNLGHLFHKSGRVRESLEPYRRAIALRPGYALARNNLAHALFLLGELAPAWEAYAGRASRLQHEAALAAAGRAYRVPSRAELRGARLGIQGEQGLGDVLFFLRFAAAAREAGATLEFAGEPRLAGMLRRTGLFESVVERFPREAAPARLEVLAGDLPLVVGAGAAPAALALAPLPERLAALRARLAALGPAPWIGIAWRSGIAKVDLQETLFKEVPLEVLGRALAAIPGTLVSVQREPAPGETETLARAAGRPVHDLAAVNEDLEEALAAMAVLDEYVGVSSTNVHLRAGTGRAGRILVPFPPEWRWMAEGESPWFPACRTYRQAPDRDWAPALARLAADLRTA